jgi:peptide/nickel transport system substrate-binding protein
MPHERDGDWGKSWLAQNGAGSGAYKIVPSTYRPLEVLDLEINENHFMGWEDNKSPVRKIAMRPTAETSTRINALLNGSMDWTDTNFPADQVDRVNASKIAHVARDTVMRTFLLRMQNQRPPMRSTTRDLSTTSWAATRRAIRCRCPTSSGAAQRTSRATTTT